MRVLVVLLVVAAAIGGLFFLQSSGSDGTGPVPKVDGPQVPAASAPVANGNVAAPGLPAGTVATRVDATPKVAENVANAPTACIQVVDYTTGKPILGAAVRRVQNGAELSFTDEHGIANLPLPDPEQLAVVFDGYLLRLVPAQLGSTEKDPQLVKLVRDEWSPRRHLHFVGPDGATIHEAFVRFRPTSPAAGTPTLPREDPVLRRAWTEHTMLASRPVCADVPVQLGGYDENRVHRLTDDTEVRFLVAGDYLVEAATANGLVSRTPVRIEQQNPAAARIDFQPGVFVDGTVVALEGSTPLAGATVTLEGGDPLGLVTTTGDAGSFRFGPVMPGPVTLHVHQGDHEPKAYGPITAPAAGVRIELNPMSKSTLRGRVRARPGLEPIAGAAVVWAAAGNASKARTGADGTFAITAKGDRAARLLIQAPGYLARSELVDPGTAFQDYDLWPGDVSARVEKGITAVFEGVVMDDAGRPLPNANVRWTPAERTAPTEFDNRRVLDGGALVLPPVIATGADGSFRLETDQFGPGRLALVDGSVGVDTKAIAGHVTDGLRLHR